MMFQILQYFTKVLIKNPPVPMRIFALLLAVLCYGATGFLYFELSNNPELTLLDGLWYTVVTMTTVGYGDFFPKTMGGRFLVGWPVMIFGIGILGYALSVVAAALISSKTKEIRGMSSFSLKKHLVIFNYPGLAKLEHLIKELHLDPVFGSHVPIILVDEFLEELPSELVKRNIHYVRGNPVRDDTLKRAAIDEARFAIVLSRNEGDTASDNLNVSVTLAIEGRNGEVHTVVEIVDPASEELLHKAGCDKVVCTARFGAHFLSQELLNPGIQEVIEDLLSAERGQNMYLVEVTRTLTFREAAGLCSSQKHIALGIHTAKEVLLNPDGSMQIQSGDRLITVGPSRLDAI